MNGGDAPASGGSQHSQHSASRTSGGSSTTARHGMVGKIEKNALHHTHSRALCCCHLHIGGLEQAWREEWATTELLSHTRSDRGMQHTRMLQLKICDEERLRYG